MREMRRMKRNEEKAVDFLHLLRLAPAVSNWLPLSRCAPQVHIMQCFRISRGQRIFLYNSLFILKIFYVRSNLFFYDEISFLWEKYGLTPMLGTMFVAMLLRYRWFTSIWHCCWRSRHRLIRVWNTSAVVVAGVAIETIGLLQVYITMMAIVVIVVVVIVMFTSSKCFQVPQLGRERWSGVDEWTLTQTQGSELLVLMSCKRHLNNYILHTEFHTYTFWYIFSLFIALLLSKFNWMWCFFLL